MEFVWLSGPWCSQSISMKRGGECDQWSYLTQGSERHGLETLFSPLDCLNEDWDVVAAEELHLVRALPFVTVDLHLTLFDVAIVTIQGRPLGPLGLVMSEN